MASERGFAFAVELRREGEGAVGRVVLKPGSGLAGANENAGRPPALLEFAEALAARRELAWEGMEGAWSINWQ